MKYINYNLLLLFIAVLGCGSLQAQSFPLDSFSVSGRVLATSGHPMPNVVVTLVGPTQVWEDTTGADGLYSFQDLPEKEDYYLSFTKDGSPENGLNHFDLLMIQRHILYLHILQPFGYYGSDYNNSGGISTLDIVLAQRIMLGLYPNVDSIEHWSFLYAYTDFDPTNPNNVAGTLDRHINTYPISQLNNNLENIDFIGLKKGDTNLSANPFE